MLLPGKIAFIVMRLAHALFILMLPQQVPREWTEDRCITEVGVLDPFFSLHQLDFRLGGCIGTVGVTELFIFLPHHHQLCYVHFSVFGLAESLSIKVTEWFIGWKVHLQCLVWMKLVRNKIALIMTLQCICTNYASNGLISHMKILLWASFQCPTFQDLCSKFLTLWEHILFCF